MINYKLLFYLMLIMFSCKHNPKLAIGDLHFPDYGRDRIRENQIDTTYLIDAFCNCIDNNNKYWNLEDYYTGYIVYNNKGNVIEIQKMEIMGTQINYKYDSMGLPEEKVYMTDFAAVFNAKYQFDSDSNILKQIWYKEIYPYDTCTFKFNPNGQLIESEEYTNDDHGKGRHFYSKFEYNGKGDLINKDYNIKYFNQQAWEESKGEPILNEYKTQYYYSNSKLDSTITHFIYKTNPKWNYFSKTYYNKVGLTTKKIDRDTIITIFIHK